MIRKAKASTELDQVYSSILFFFISQQTSGTTERIWSSFGSAQTKRILQAKAPLAPFHSTLKKTQENYASAHNSTTHSSNSEPAAWIQCPVKWNGCGTFTYSNRLPMWGDNKGHFQLSNYSLFLTNTMAKIAGLFPKSTQQTSLQLSNKVTLHHSSGK